MGAVANGAPQAAPAGRCALELELELEPESRRAGPAGALGGLASRPARAQTDRRSDPAGPDGTGRGEPDVSLTCKQARVSYDKKRAASRPARSGS